MRRFFYALAIGLALLGPAPAAVLDLHRGVGVHEWLNWSPLAADGSYRWPPYRSEAEWLAGYRPLTDWPAGDQFQRIRALGFDFVRLSIDPGPLLANSGTRRQQALDVLASAIGAVTAAGLRVVVDLHAVTQPPAYGMAVLDGTADPAALAHYRDMVVAVAGMLEKIGTDKVALEPYNEPSYYPCGPGGNPAWQPIMAATVAAIRAVSADLTLIVTGACGGSITGLTALDPSFDDANLYYSFHMYEPHSFTHQRLDDPKAFASGLPWPAATGSPQAVIETLRARMAVAGVSAAAATANLAALNDTVASYFRDDWGPAQLTARFGEAAAWAKAHHIPATRLFMGEFGAMLMSKDGRSGAFDADRRRYLTAVREAAEGFGIPWSIWEYSNPFGMSVIVPDGPALPDQGLLTALGL